jgi:hypothetical protein
LNTRSSTEAELVGADDAMGMILWTRLFLESQGYMVRDTKLYQDNRSAMLLERNGKQSSSKRTRHINIRYFFITDCIQNNQVCVEYCPTTDMVADIFTKPLQGSAFHKFRDAVLNVPTILYDSCNELAIHEPQECVGEERDGLCVARKDIGLEDTNNESREKSTGGLSGKA